MRATKYEKYLTGNIHALAHLWRENAQIEYSSQKMAQLIHHV